MLVKGNPDSIVFVFFIGYAGYVVNGIMMLMACLDVTPSCDSQLNHSQERNIHNLYNLKSVVLFYLNWWKVVRLHIDKARRNTPVLLLFYTDVKKAISRGIYELIN